MTSNKSIGSTNRSRKNYCSNCGKYGHNVKKCDEPTTSLGVMCVKFCNLPFNKEVFNKFLSSRYLEIDNYNFSHIDNINKLEYFKKNIKFLMIRRKHSLSYIEFIRGKYDINNMDQLIKLFKHMSPEEIDKISKNDFNYLWSNLWKKTSNNKLFQKEYKQSKELFEKLILFGKITSLIKIKPLFDSPEWGFPKGRRNLFEKNIDCALRELEEETTIKSEDVDILNKISNVVEQYVGSNNIEYRHIYYLSFMDDETYGEDYFNLVCNIESNCEVSCVKWFTWDEAVENIRGYYTEKIKVVNMIYFLFLNLYLEYITKEGIVINQ
jgi:8-oxo-dGTP pyrophosphatase MutT (NUDIX family)